MTRSRLAPPCQRRPRADGFTLVEVLVALLIMALLTALTWRALDAVVRARDEGQASVDSTVRLATVLTQWEQDLQALHDTELVPPLVFDGQTLRMTRRAEGGVQLVAWAVRSGRWQRWAGPTVARGAELQEAWLRSQQLLGTEPGTVLLGEGVSSWQLYFARGGQWSNAQSTGNVVAVPSAPAPAASGASAPAGAVQLREELPEAVRLQIFFGDKPLTRDIALGPAAS